MAPRAVDDSFLSLGAMATLGRGSDRWGNGDQCNAKGE